MHAYTYTCIVAHLLEARGKGVAEGRELVSRRIRNKNGKRLLPAARLRLVDKRLKLVVHYAARHLDVRLRGVERQVPLLRALEQLTSTRRRQQQCVCQASKAETAVHRAFELAANHRPLNCRVQHL